MGKTAFLFPGQGSQATDMGRTFYDEWPEFRAAFDRMNGSVDVDLPELVFEGSQERLTETRYTQPAVLAVGAAAAVAIDERHGVTPDLVAGHSLGHFTAHVSAGSLDAESAISLVSERGRLMQRAGEQNGPGTMIAVLFADPADVASICAEYEQVSVAVYNGPRQTVVSGAVDQVEAVREALDAEYRVRFSELSVGTAFHSPLMRTAVESFADRLESASFTEAAVPIVSDVSTDPYETPLTARRELAAQMTSPVQWTGVVESLADAGVTCYVEFPPSGTLASIVERMDVDGETTEIESPADLTEMATDV